MTDGSSLYWERVFEVWFNMMKKFGLFGGVGLGFIIYKAWGTSSKIDKVIGLIFIGLISAGVVILIIATIVAAVIGRDDKHLLKWESGGEVSRILRYISQPSLYSSWKMGCEALVRIGKPAIPDLIHALSDSTGSPGPSTGESIQSTDWLRGGAAYCLGRLKEPTALEHLQRALNDKESFVRKNCCLALGELGSLLAIQGLQRISDSDSSAEVREAAARAIRMINKANAPVDRVDISEEKILNILEKKFAKVRKFNIMPQIPQKKLDNAITSCDLSPSESILGLYDFSMFGSVKDCFVFGRNGIYFSFGKKKLNVPYHDFPSKEFNLKGFADLTYIQLTEDESISCGSTSRNQKILDALVAIRDIVAAEYKST